MGKKRTATEKLETKRQLLLARTAAVFDCPEAEAATLLSQGLASSFRLNTLRATDPVATLQQLQHNGWRGAAYGWHPDGFTVTGDKSAVSTSSAARAGEIYIQNAASWLPVLNLGPQPGETILDMCAAPGGKASHIAAVAHNQAELWVNDNSRPRFHTMLATFKRLGVIYHNATILTIARLAHELPSQYFDKILLDAPCSGEGLINLSVGPKSLHYWSLAHIKRLQSLQKQAMNTAWQLLKPGGRLIYSTCTIAPEENEGVVQYLLDKQPAAQLQPLAIKPANALPGLHAWQGKQYTKTMAHAARIMPDGRLEAFFIAHIRKTAEET
jgi:16S rRNA (cytosine1407-C5)-methyltransferase